MNWTIVKFGAIKGATTALLATFWLLGLSTYIEVLWTAVSNQPIQIKTLHIDLNLQPKEK